MNLKWWRSRETASAPVSRADDDGREMTRRAFAAATTPGAPALLAELERGWARQDASEMHAYEITPNDAAFLRMMAGATFGPESTVVIPSGKTITGAEMARWLKAQR